MNEMEEQVISLSEIFDALKKRWIMIVFVIYPVYEISTKVFVGKEENDEAAYKTNDIQMYQKLL